MIVTKLKQINIKFNVFLLTLIIIDLFFITASWINNHTDLLNNNNFDIKKDLGFPEAFQYFKEFFTAVIFIKIFKKSSDHIYIIWSLFFTYLLLDDSIQIHENVGTAISNYFFDVNSEIVALGLRGQDFGELTISCLVGSVFIFFFIKYFYKSKQVVKDVSFNIAFLVLILVFCGVFIDMAHIIYPKFIGIATLEDGGEMIAMSLICWYSYEILNFNSKPVPSILNPLIIKTLNRIANYFYNLYFRLHLK